MRSNLTPDLNPGFLVDLLSVEEETYRGLSEIPDGIWDYVAWELKLLIGLQEIQQRNKRKLKLSLKTR